jgi:hypothetical protein
MIDFASKLYIYILYIDYICTHAHIWQAVYGKSNKIVLERAHAHFQTVPPRHTRNHRLQQGIYHTCTILFCTGRRAR